jgi:hypothetical protein
VQYKEQEEAQIVRADASAGEWTVVVKVQHVTPAGTAAVRCVVGLLQLSPSSLLTKPGSTAAQIA